ncbi:MAG: GNAT family N-acetyltransferase [Anaerolineae bacterium]|nr:GNAT family N-acetyltransferase [Anaerolineae bacterium]
MTLTFRPTTLDDAYTLFEIFRASVTDLGERIGAIAITGGNDPAFLTGLWERRRPLVEHLQNTAEQSWLAENDGKIIGYARSILRDGVRQLTEFFVDPTQQSAGVGRGLLSRAFPSEGANRRFIIASIDRRAQALYMKSGVYPRFPIGYLSRPAEAVAISTDLIPEPITDQPEILSTLAELDTAVLSYRRDAEHRWLMAQRQGYLYRRNGQAVAYGYVGRSSGPFAVLDPRDYPAVLALAENEAARQGHEFGVEVPLMNRFAVDHMLSRGAQLDSFFEFFMSDVPFGQFEQYIFTSPPFFV